MSETTAEEPVRGNLTFPEMLRAAMSAMPAHSTLRQMLLETRGHIEKLEADLEAAEERAQKAEARRYNAERAVAELRVEQVRLKAELEDADSAQAQAEARVKELSDKLSQVMLERMQDTERAQESERASAVRVLRDRQRVIVAELQGVDLDSPGVLEGPVRLKLAAHRELEILADRIDRGEV